VENLRFGVMPQRAKTRALRTLPTRSATAAAPRPPCSWHRIGEQGKKSVWRNRFAAAFFWCSRWGLRCRSSCTQTRARRSALCSGRAAARLLISFVRYRRWSKCAAKGWHFWESTRFLPIWEDHVEREKLL